VSGRRPRSSRYHLRGDLSPALRRQELRACRSEAKGSGWLCAVAILAVISLTIADAGALIVNAPAVTSPSVLAGGMVFDKYGITHVISSMARATPTGCPTQPTWGARENVTGSFVTFRPAGHVTRLYHAEEITA